MSNLSLLAPHRKAQRKAFAVERGRALTARAQAVREGRFPDAGVSGAVAPGEHDPLREALDRLRPVHE